MKINEYGNYFEEWPIPQDLAKMLRYAKASDLRLAENFDEVPGYRAWAGFIEFKGWQCHFRASSTERWSEFAHNGQSHAHLCIGWVERWPWAGRLGTDRDDAPRLWLMSEIRVAELMVKQYPSGMGSRSHAEKLAKLRRQLVELN